MSAEFWYMFPLGIAMTAVGIASGVGGATFYSPLFILGLGLPPPLAIGAGLIVEACGFGSGVYAYLRRRLIDHRIVRAMLVATVPAALAGTLVAHYVRADILKSVLGMGLFAVAASFLRTPDAVSAARLNDLAEESPDAAGTCLTTARGEEICYTVCNKTEGRLISGLGAFFMGAASSGLGELNGYFLLQRCRVPVRVSVATTVVVVAATALVASIGHIVQIGRQGLPKLVTMGNLLLFTVPGVVIGAQLGPMLADRVPDRVMEVGLGLLFTITGGLLLVEAGLN
ncbi:MAG: sulfite exporter TauE/SafE family protein [Salinibacter sp.]|uniref:sulfite exporter TauE/SafE family protein n=1 Tax=Salinibacter sp. TaxID=2065818 RepID=UPI002FC32FCE